MRASHNQREMKSPQSKLCIAHQDILLLMQYLVIYQEHTCQALFRLCDMAHNFLHSESGNVLTILLVDKN